MQSITIAIVGAGGSGVVSLGEMILKAAAKAGYYGLMRKSFGPQIRGGESAAIIRLAEQPVGNFTDDIHLLFALEWRNFSRFGDEIPVSNQTLVIQDSTAGDLPNFTTNPIVTTLNFKAAAQEAESDKANMALFGYVGAWLNLSHQELEEIVFGRLSKLEHNIQVVNVSAMSEGMKLLQQHPLSLARPASNQKLQSSKPWIATGNQLAGLGALEAGIRFVAAYPITPASDCLEWMAPHMESVQGHLVQAEDELAAINMVIGAGYSGVPAMTATSGPGLSLMCEAMGLAIASETPTVILDVMRGGPSTGIPTKSEQTDLNIALYGMHGDAPHVVLSALSIEDCFYTMAWASQLAFDLQTLVIVLSDQFLGQSSKIIDPLSEVPFKAPALPVMESLKNAVPVEDYMRYEDTETGISPMATPGAPGCMYTADGLEHNEHAVPSPSARYHHQQLDKRLRKLNQYDVGDSWGVVSGEGDWVVVCWGSLQASVLEAQRLLQDMNIAIKVIALRLISPLPQSQLQAAFGDAHKILVVEQNHQGQLAHYLRGHVWGEVQFVGVAHPGPNLITPAKVVAAVEDCFLDIDAG